MKKEAGLEKLCNHWRSYSIPASYVNSFKNLFLKLSKAFVNCQEHEVGILNKTDKEKIGNDVWQSCYGIRLLANEI